MTDATDALRASDALEDLVRLSRNSVKSERDYHLIQAYEATIRAALTAPAQPEDEVSCAGCYLPYGRFPDLVIPEAVWKQIAPNPDGSGVLCPTCLCAKLEDAGLTCHGTFTSGPLAGINRPPPNPWRAVADGLGAPLADYLRSERQKYDDPDWQRYKSRRATEAEEALAAYAAAKEAGGC